MRRTVGIFETETSMGGHPVWCEVCVDGNRIRFTHRDIRDLLHAVKQIKRDAKDALPDGFKDEV